MDDKDFEELLLACSEVSEMFPDVVYIGGIAVYLHAANHAGAKEFADTTHDSDFYISITDMSDLRDIEEVSTNRRLSKSEMTKRGFAFDIYTERHSALIVPYDQVSAHARTYGQFRVACLEHLVALKLEAFLDRRGSVKGDKDAKDLLRIAIVSRRGGLPFDANILAPHTRPPHLQLLEQVERGPYAMALAHGNAMEAKKIRSDFSVVFDAIKAAYTETRGSRPPEPPPSPEPTRTSTSRKKRK